MSVVFSDFGVTPDGRRVLRAEIANGELKAAVISYGAALAALEVPCGDVAIDVALGYDRLEDYIAGTGCLGGTPGRCANRIARGRFSLDGREYVLPANDGENHLHGGPEGFSRRVWEAEELPDGVKFSYVSPDGEEGYPGTVRAEVSYVLKGRALCILYRAVTDAPTPVNLTNHTYFNLNGAGSGSAMGHELQIFAQNYTPVLAGCIPTGEIAPVARTPMDFREMRAISSAPDMGFEQLALCGGYDHNYMIDGEAGTLRRAALLRGDRTGLVMETLTTSPAVQFYAANGLGGGPAGKGGAVYANNDAVCLETQFPPDAVNHPNFPQCVLRPGEVWTAETVYRFPAQRADAGQRPGV